MGYDFGFIGTGNMGSALAEAVSKKLGGGRILLSNRTMSKAEELALKIGAKAADNLTVAQECKYIFLGVKPQMMGGMLEKIRDVLGKRRESVVLVSMAAGLSCEKISAMAGGGMKVIRIMPNTPVAIGKGVVLYCANDLAEKNEIDEVVGALELSGFTDCVDEGLIDAASAVAGCGPAFAYMFAEALADGGVACGLPRAKALAYAAKMLEGSAAMITESQKHPGELKDAVCSPGGSTIKGVQALENGGFRACVFNAVESAYKRTKEL